MNASQAGRDSRAPAAMEQTVAARLTAEIPSAIATIGVRGPAALAAVLRYVRLESSSPRLSHIYYGLWQLAGGDYGEQVVVCRTGEETIEIHCHGGQAVCQSILHDLSLQGCQLISASDWPDSLVAWPTADRCPLAQAAERDLLEATTERAAAVLLDQLNGALHAAVERVVEHLRDGEVAAAASELEQLLTWSRLGLRLAEPWRVVLAGPPNVGKSSLINALVGQPRAIVHHEPGTTRDWLEASTAIAGWPVALTDTAGIRTTSDTIESEGVARAQQQIAAADAVLLVVDAAGGWTETHTDILGAVDRRRAALLIVWNKADLGAAPPPSLCEISPVVAASTLGPPGIEELASRLGELLVPRTPGVGQAVPFRLEQVECLSTALNGIQHGQPAEALAALQLLLP